MILPALVLAVIGAANAASVLPRAHSHNDYKRNPPLRAALDQGFMSVEADAHLRGRELLIGHTGGEIKPGVTLQSLYLDPLLTRVRANGGRVYPGGPKGFQLLVEFKSDADESYLALREILRGYTEMLTAFDNGNVREGAVTIVITGRRPESLLRAEPLRWAALDGDIGDIDSPDPGLFVTISADWGSRFQWRGGRIEPAERRRLAQYAARAHARGRKLRFWAIPDREEAWELMYDEGVDLINTDKVAELAAFLRRQGPESSLLRRLKRAFGRALEAPGFDEAR